MSNYYAPAYHPIEKVIRKAEWLDNYFMHHEYGVRFDDDPHVVFRANDCQIPIDKIFVEKQP